jgi:methyl-accepting chemotaxis protein
MERKAQGRAADHQPASLAESEQTPRTVTPIAAVAFLCSALLVLLLNHAIARPLVRISGMAERIAAGDLTIDVAECGRTDEVGVMQATFAKMVSGLRDITRQIREATGVLAAAGTEILAATTQLASSAAETASAVAETTTTLEEVKQTSQVSSQKARAVSDEARKAADVAGSGRHSVEQTIEGMEGIQRQMSAIAESIINLSTQSQSIGEILTSVDDLAAQSKLLAVNASIEAAKAGEEGKGFSVVAQEVKSLAEQSKQATAQVRGILNDIQTATSTAELATEQGGRAVEAGVSQSARAGESIHALTENIAQAAQAATQIAATSQQQYVGVDQVALAMENIKAASTQTVVSTRQAESAAQQLHDLGQNLKLMVDRFKV